MTFRFPSDCNGHNGLFKFIIFSNGLHYSCYYMFCLTHRSPLAFSHSLLNSFINIVVVILLLYTILFLYTSKAHLIECVLTKFLYKYIFLIFISCIHKLNTTTIILNNLTTNNSYNSIYFTIVLSTSSITLFVIIRARKL